MKNSICKAVLLCLGVFSLTTAKAQKHKKPNVLLIYTDDHRFSGIHALGGQPVKTPNIDALANTGMVFTEAHLMGAFSGATCMPSRAMLNSGKQLFHLTDIGHVLPKTDVTIGEAFKQGGYNTYMVGKWHQDRGSLARSFDDGASVMGIGVYLTDHYRMPIWDWDKTGKFPKKDAYLLTYDEQGKTKRRAITKNDKRGPTGTELTGPHTSEIFAENASKYIKNYKKRDPFFMYLAFHAPHDPRQAPKKYQDMYPVNEMELTPSYMSQHPFDNGDMYLRDEELAAWPRTPQVSKKELSAYYAIITHLDAQIGKVVQSLKDKGEYENTIIVLVGDSGLAVGNHGLMGKQNVYEEDGIHVPLIFSGGYVKQKGTRYNALSYIHDIYPTVCDMAGISIPKSVEGKSLKPVMDGAKKQVYNYGYYAYKQFQRAYRKGDYKLIEYVKSPNNDWKRGYSVKGSRVTQLFNIKKDPWETQNLAFFPEHKALLKEMQEEFVKAGKDLDDYKQGIGVEYDFWDYYN
ncbi:sulfatase-like hydrolase/transferase [Wenyingzhuangia sp. 2_MG-2023]|uniref:sulfatase-like hydrolase/transferase n=1 Tax=Wenyingzhuangia sp. 2_MG-2023 TaxID=3062639 RepID=UPI0026E467CD|nr:sulfatase-like hydrolase/transferase [Wenyingzhuangia sp. 2_MG-2023]MDO6736365.1 sulfatase-like hydrolase/transferase [Wenyingzhuangia sp. 2_MG-2023]